MIKFISTSLLLFLGATTALFGGPQDVQRQGEPFVNMLQAVNPGFENGIAKWTVSAGTLTKVTSAANVAVGTAAASWDASATGQFLTSTQVTIPSGLYGRECRVAVYLKGGDSNLTVRVIDGSIATVAESALVGAFTSWTKFVLPFTCPSSGTLALRLASTGNAAIAYIDNAFLGESDAIEGSAIQSNVAFTGGGTWSGNTTYTASYSRRGKLADITYRVETTGAPSPSSTTLALNLPSGLTPDTTAAGYDFNNYRQVFGSGHATDSGSNILLQVAYHAGSGGFIPVYYTTAGTVGDPVTLQNVIQHNVPFTWAASNYLVVTFTVPIAQWSDNVYFAKTTLEYAYNSDLTDADDAVSFGYGPQGAQFANITANRSKKVRFQTAISPTDQIQVQVTNDSGVTWVTPQASTGISQWMSLNGKSYGIGYQFNSGDPHVIDIRFAGGGRDSSGAATYGADGNPWSDIDNIASSKWRVLKASNPLALGHKNVSQTESGLVAGAGQLLGTNTNDNACSGCVGEYLSQTRLAASALVISTGVSFDLTASPLALTAGDWDVQCSISYNLGGGGAVTEVNAAVSPTSATLAGEIGTTRHISSYTSLTNVSTSLSSPVVRVSLASPANYYCVGSSNFSGSADAYGHFRARRVR